MTERVRPSAGDVSTANGADAVKAIADALWTAYDDDPAAQIGAAATMRRASLEAGRAGAAVFFAYLAASRDDGSEARWERERAETLLGAAIAVTDPTESSGLLHHGAVGVAWAATHLGDRFGIGRGGDGVGERFADAVDAALLERVSVSLWTGDYDLIVGLVGFGLYALERLPRPRAVQCVEQIVARLDELAERCPDGVTWWTSPELTRRPDELPRGFYSLGLSHGVPGAIGLLAQAVAADIAVERARPLLDGAVTWLLAQQLPAGAGSRFPAWIEPDVAPTAHRQTWCYGDLGIGCALLVAGRSLGDEALTEEARAIAVAAATAPFKPKSIEDATFCHGAMGNAHLLRRLFMELGDQALQDAADASLRRGLAMRRPGGRLGAFSVAAFDPERRMRRIAYRGLLMGSAGIGLALLAATSRVEPAWDRLFLVSPAVVLAV